MAYGTGDITANDVFSYEYDSLGNVIGCTTTFTIGATNYATITSLFQYYAKIEYKIVVYAHRTSINSKKLYIDISNTTATYEMEYRAPFGLGGMDATFSRDCILYKPSGSGQLTHMGIQSEHKYTHSSGTQGGILFNLDERKTNTVHDNVDEPLAEDFGLLMSAMGAVQGNATAIIEGNADTEGDFNQTYKSSRSFKYLYPPCVGIKPNGFDDKVDDNNNKVSNGGASGTSGAINLTADGTKITKKNASVKYSWSPNGTSYVYGLTVVNSLTVNGTTYSPVNSPKSVNAPNIHGTSYTAQVKRGFKSDAPIENVSSYDKYSNTLYMYTYSYPTLSSISLNKYNISARNNESLTLSLDCNNRNLTVENNFRTGIWSNYKSKYYIDYETTDKSRILSVAEIKTLAPDSKAVNGITTATISVNRRNLGVSGGNPGKDSLVYETGTKTKEIKVYYKPQVALNPSDGSISYYKVEKGTRGSQINAKTTWVLPNTYNINDMTGIDVRLIYPKTDTSGVINGYKVELLLPNDGTHGTDYVWNTLYFYTEDYDYYARIPYDKLKRGISGNRIRITPFYVPEGVGKSDSNANRFWYGPSTTKDFVDISWMLNDPVIDCPLNNTTWHNHQYRILFKLPIDNDTNYKGINDIEVHYGSGKYRYQEIEISINGNRALLGNNVYMNAQNSWVSVTNVDNAKLTYLREIIINPVLLPNYKNESSYRIMIRVRKAYGQNSNFDGWSNWSSAVVVNTKTVSNTNVQKDEYIMASHYMNVQNAFNNSLSCYSKKASDNSAFVVQESFDRSRGHNINGPHLSPPTNTPLQTVKEYVSEFNDLHQLKNKINSYAKFDTDKNRNSVKLDYQDKLLASFTPLQEFITAAKDQNGATENIGNPPNLKGRNYMKYMCDEINNLK